MGSESDRQGGGSLAGKLLVAMPNMGDPRFARAVILLCSHDDDHAMGLVVNKPREDITLGDVLSHMDVAVGEAVSALPVLDGGPVKPDRGYVLHSDDYAAPDATQDVAPGVRLTVTRDALEALGEGPPPRNFALALGYSGWGAGQLESELAMNAWLVAEPDDAIVFGGDHGGKWSAAVKRIGVEPAMLSGEMGRA